MFQRPKRPENMDPEAYPEEEQNLNDEQEMKPSNPIKTREFEMMNHEMMKTTASFSKDRIIKN